LIDTEVLRTIFSVWEDVLPSIGLNNWWEMLNISCSNNNVSHTLQLPRFIVRTHHLNTTQTWWRSGTVLEFESSIALVKADRSGKSISISIMNGNDESRGRLLARSMYYSRSRFRTGNR
jgi:hypothetical protein